MTIANLKKVCYRLNQEYILALQVISKERGML